MSRRQAMSVYFACLVLSVVLLVFGSSIVSLVAIFPVVFGSGLLVREYGKRAYAFGLAGYLVTGLLSVFVYAWSHPRSPRSTMRVPGYLRGLEIQDRGAVKVSDPFGEGGPEQFPVSWVHAPKQVAEVQLRKHDSKQGFGTSDKESAAQVNFDSGESWNLYVGQRVLPSFPKLDGSTINPGTADSWCTLVYRPPSRN